MSFLYPCFWGTSTSWSTGYTAQCHLCLLLVSHSPLLGNWSGLRLSVTVVSPSPHWSRSSRCPSSPQPLSLSCCPSILWSWNFLVTFLSCSKTFNCPSHAEKTKTRPQLMYKVPQLLSQYLLHHYWSSSLCSSYAPSLALPQMHPECQASLLCSYCLLCMERWTLHLYK